MPALQLVAHNEILDVDVGEALSNPHQPRVLTPFGEGIVLGTIGPGVVTNVTIESSGRLLVVVRKPLPA